MSIHDPEAEITPALNATLRARWKTLKDAERLGDAGAINAATTALNSTLNAVSDAIGEPRDPKPAILFKLEYPDA